MINELSKIGLTTILVASLILMCGCTGTEVVSLDSPNPSASSGGQANNPENVASPSATHSPTYVPTANPTYTPTPTTSPTLMPSPTPTDTPVSSSQKPSIVSAKTDKVEYSVNNEKVTLTIVADSNSAVKGYSLKLDGPDGNILDGPAQIAATYLGNDQWKYDVTFFTYTTITPGEYKWSQIRVMNKDDQWSDDGPSASFKVINA